MSATMNTKKFKAWLKTIDGPYSDIWEELEDHHEGMRDSAPRTMSEYRTAWKEYVAWLKENKETISPRALNKFVRDMRDGWHPAFRPEKIRKSRSDQTIRKYIWHLRHIIYFAAKRGYFDHFDVELPKAKKGKGKDALTMEQIKVIDDILNGVKLPEPEYDFSSDPPSNEAERKARHQWEKAMSRWIKVNWHQKRITNNDKLRFWLLLETGMRAGEALKVTWDDIDLEEGTIYIKPGKTGEGRKIAIDTLWHRLSVLLNEVEDKTGYVLKAKGKSKLTYQGMRKFYDKLNFCTGLKFGRHDLRATFATLAFQARIPANVIEIQGGWKDLKVIIDHYDKTEVGDMVRIFYRP